MTGPFDVLLEPTEKKNTHTAPVVLANSSGRYRLGTATRPHIRHDNGHLDKFPKREPNASDRIQFAKWVAKLQASEALCNARTGKFVSGCHSPDLSDASAAYRHFLFGKGKDRTIDYERFLQNDGAGCALVKNLVVDFRKHAEIIGKNRVKFSVTSTEYIVGNGGFAEYPQTTNWQKTLGAHYVWVSADAVVSADAKGKIRYEADLTIHMEDRYNFNPGATDIASGIPDSENGRFEITGLASQYMNYAVVHRHISWEEGATK